MASSSAIDRRNFDGSIGMDRQVAGPYFTAVEQGPQARMAAPSQPWSWGVAEGSREKH